MKRFIPVATVALLLSGCATETTVRKVPERPVSNWKTAYEVPETAPKPADRKTKLANEKKIRELLEAIRKEAK